MADRPAPRRAARWARRAIKDAGRCPVSICFALEGSSRISPATYALQQTFAALTAAVLSTDTDATRAAAQFDRLAIPISPINDDIADFVYLTGNSTLNGEADINLAGGLGYCGFQVASSDRDMQVVVVVGSGDFSIGFSPETVTAQILPPNGVGRIYGVSTVGDADNFLPVVGGDAERVFTLRSAADIADIVSTIVEDACNVKVCDPFAVESECAPEQSPE